MGPHSGDDISDQMGRKRLNRTWAKLEIVLGLIAGVIGLLTGIRCVTRPEIDFAQAALAAALSVFGFYLAMAGHRSHLYQSQNETTAWLAARIEGRAFTDAGRG